MQPEMRQAFQDNNLFTLNMRVRKMCDKFLTPPLYFARLRRALRVVFILLQFYYY